MTPRTLFSIIVKVFGLIFIKEIFQIITQLLPSVVYFFKPDMESVGTVTIAIYLLYILVYGLFAYYLIVKSDLVVEKLKLDAGYDEEIFQFNMHRSSVLAISLIVIGGLLIVEGIPNFLGQLGLFYQRINDRYRQDSPSIVYAVIAGAKIALGFLLIAEKKWIINFIELRRKK